MSRSILLAIITTLSVASVSASLQEKLTEPFSSAALQKIVLTSTTSLKSFNLSPAAKAANVAAQVAGHIGCEILLTKDQPGDTPYRQLIVQIAQTQECFFLPAAMEGNPLLNDSTGKATTAVDTFLKDHLATYYGQTLHTLIPTLAETIGYEHAASFKDTVHQELRSQILDHLKSLSDLS